MPKLSDSEVITMEIVGEFMGKDHGKGIWRYFRNHWHDWLSNLGSRANFAKQSANLWALKRRIQDHIAWQIIVALQKILGHSSLNIAMRYSHLSPDYLIQAVLLNPLARINESGKLIVRHKKTS